MLLLENEQAEASKALKYKNKILDHFCFHTQSSNKWDSRGNSISQIDNIDIKVPTIAIKW